MPRTIKIKLPSLTEERLLFREKMMHYERNPNPRTSGILSAISGERQFYNDDSIYDKSFQYLEETYGDIYKLADAKLLECKSDRFNNYTDKEQKEWRKLLFVSNTQCKEFFEDMMYLDQPVAQILRHKLSKVNVNSARKRFRNWLNSK